MNQWIEWKIWEIEWMNELNGDHFVDCLYMAGKSNGKKKIERKSDKVKRKREG